MEASLQLVNPPKQILQWNARIEIFRVRRLGAGPDGLVHRCINTDKSDKIDVKLYKQLLCWNVSSIV